MVVNPLSHPFTPPATMLGGGGEWEEEEVMVRSVSGTYASSNGDLLRFLTAMLSTMKRANGPPSRRGCHLAAAPEPGAVNTRNPATQSNKYIDVCLSLIDL